MKKIVIIIFLFTTMSFSLMIFNNLKENILLSEKNNSKINNTFAVYLKDSEEYTLSKTLPSKTDGYRFNHAECKDATQIIWNYSLWSAEISNIEDGEISCKLFFDKENSPAKDYILNHITTINTRNNLAITLTNTTTGVIYESDDDYGLTYYYAGAPTDNYLQFAGFWWRIIRINGDGTIRLIYAGNLSDYSAGLSNGYDDSSTLYQSIGANLFNTSTNGQRYIGYYSETSNLHGISDISNIATQLNTWYQNHLLVYNEYISNNTLFCNDRTAYTDETGNNEADWSNVPLYYGAYIRLQTEKEPSLKCSNNLDAFTVENADNYGYSGNGALTRPIGLITADEVAYAGGVYNVSNNQYFLYTNTITWTMSPARYDDGEGRMWHIGAPGGLNYNNGLVTVQRQTRPVINLRADVTLTGSGTASDPYVVVGAE